MKAIQKTEVSFKGKIITLRYTKVELPNIYSTKDQRLIEENCKKLRIHLDELGEGWADGHAPFTYDDFFILIERNNMEYTQYIVRMWATKTNLRALGKCFPRDVKEWLVEYGDSCASEKKFLKY